MKNLLKCQKIIIIQQEMYQIICIIENIKNSLVQIYQDKKIPLFLKKKFFFRKLEEDNSVTIIFIAQKQQKTIRNFSLDSLIVKE